MYTAASDNPLSLLMTILQDVLMVKRADLENKQVVKDFWDDVKAACICSDKFTEECYLCETRDHTDQLNWCEHCNSYFCEVSVPPLICEIPYCISCGRRVHIACYTSASV